MFCKYQTIIAYCNIKKCQAVQFLLSVTLEKNELINTVFHKASFKCCGGWCSSLVDHRKSLYSVDKCVCKNFQVTSFHDLRMLSTNKYPGTTNENRDCNSISRISALLFTKVNGIKPWVLSARFFLTLLVVAFEVL